MASWHPIVEFLGAIVGVDPDDWPAGDEDALREYARQYDAIAAELRATVAGGCREGSTAIGAAWNGAAGKALAAQVLAYGTDKDFGGAESIAAAAAEVAQYLRDQADTIVRTKVMIIAQIAVGILMFAIPAGKAISLGMRQLLREGLKNFIRSRARTAIKDAVAELAARAAKPLAITSAKFFRGAVLAGVGAGAYGLAPNTIAQAYGELTHQTGRTAPDGTHADGWNWDETKQAAEVAAVATPIAMVTGAGLAKLGGVATRNVSSVTGWAPRMLGRRTAGAVTMAVSMPAANSAVVTHQLPGFEEIWKSAVMGAAIPGGGSHGSHGPDAGVPKADPVEVAPVRNHSTIGGADHPPPDPPQQAVKPGLEATHSTDTSATNLTGSSQTTGGTAQAANANAHNTGAESRAETGAATTNLNSSQPAAGAITPEASARPAARATTTETATSKTPTPEQHAKPLTPEKSSTALKAAPPDKPPAGPDKPAAADTPASTDKAAAPGTPTGADRPAVAEKQAVPAAGAKGTPQPEAAAHPAGKSHPRVATPPGEQAPRHNPPAEDGGPRADTAGGRAQDGAQQREAAREVPDWTQRQEHREEVQRREADANQARGEHQRAVDARENGPSVKETELAAKQAGKELKAAERALEKHEAKHGTTDDSGRARELRDRFNEAATKHDAAQQELAQAKQAEANVGNAKVAAEARRISYLTAKLDFVMSRLSPAELRQLGEGRLDVLRDAVRENVTRDEALQLAIHELIHRTEDGWGFALKWTQLQAELALRDDLLVQMMTGEGKTAVAAVALGMIAADRPVHFMTSNRSLSAQAYTKFRKVLEPLGYDVVHVDPAVRYPKPRGRTVYVGDVAAFGWSMGRGHRVPGKDVIVDEIDAVAVELAAQHYTHSSGAAGKASAKTEAEVMLAKWALDSGRFDHADLGLTAHGEPLNGARPELTAEGRRKLAELTGVEPTSRQFAKQVTRLENAAQARWGLHEGRDYIRATIGGKETILIVSKHSGEPLVDRETLLEQRWTDVAQALEARHGLEVRADPSHTNSIHTKKLLESYDHVSGMSGTAKDAEQAIRDLYGEHKVGRVVEIDRFNESKLEVRPPQHFATVEEKYRAIVDQAIADMAKDGDLSNGRPQAIVTEHNDEVALVERLLTERLRDLPADGIRIEKVDAERMAGFIADRTFDASMDAIWKRAGERGTITIGNKVLGRGIDIEIHPDAFTYGDRPDATDPVFTVQSRDGKEAISGGLAVRVGFHDADSPRGTVQALNRAGRQGAPGEASLYASHQDELFRRRPTALEAAVAYHEAPATAAHNEALRAYTDAAIARARAAGLGETGDALKAAAEALRKAEEALPAADYSAAIETAQRAAQQATLTTLGATHTTATPHPRTADLPDDSSRSRRVADDSGTADNDVPGLLQSAPSYQGLSAADQARVVDAIKQLTGNDAVLVEGLRPLLESPGLRSLEPVELLAEVHGWRRYNDLFGRAVELGAPIAGSPDRVPVEHWASHGWADATDLGEPDLSEPLSTSGRPGQIVTLDENSGVYSIRRGGAEWIIKLFPDRNDEQQRLEIANEFAGVVAAAGTGYGPTPYGLVRAHIGDKRYIGMAMGRVRGAMVHDPQPSEPGAVAEVERARRAVTFDTVLQLHQYLARLLDDGYHSDGELQPLVDPETGNLRMIDLADIKELLDDPLYQRIARADHGLGLESADLRDQLVKAAIENARRDAGRARILETSVVPGGMTEAAAEQAVEVVRKGMRLPETIALRFVVGANNAELVRDYGIEPAVGRRPGYFRMEDGIGVVYLSAQDHLSPAGIRATVWHEVVGHFGWRLFSPEDRAAMLAEVHELRGLIPDLSTEIEELYADQPPDVRAEEFLARLTEGEVPSRVVQAWNAVLATRFGTVLHRIGAISNEQLTRARHHHELEPLYEYVRDLVQAIRRNRPVYDASPVVRTRTGRPGPNIARIRPARDNKYDGEGLPAFSSGLVETSYDELLHGTADEQALAAVLPETRVKRFLVRAVDEEHFEIEGQRLTPHHLAVMTDLYQGVSIVLDGGSHDLAQKLTDIMGVDVTIRTADGWEVLHPRSPRAQEGTVEFGPDGAFVLHTKENPAGVPIENVDRHLGRLLGIGGSKAAFAFYDKVVLIALPTVEVSFFTQLERLEGLLAKPGAADVIAPVHYTTAFGRDAFVADRFPRISRDVWVSVPDFAAPDALRATQATLDSLLKIRAFMVANNLTIGDLQFGIDPDGRFWVYDVGRVRPLTVDLPAGADLGIFKPTDTNPLEVVDAWIAWAARGQTFTPVGQPRKSPPMRDDLQPPSYDWTTATDHPATGLYPDTPAARERAVAELERAYVAARTGYGPVPVGLVTTDIDGARYVGFAVQPVEPAANTATLDTVLQVHDYVRRLHALGYYPAVELQGTVDNHGLFHATDSSGLELLPGDAATTELTDSLLQAAFENVKRAVSNQTGRDRRVDREQPRGGSGSIHRRVFRGDGRRTANPNAVWAAVERVLPQIADAVGTVRDEVRAIALDANRITITLWGGQELTAELTVSGDFTDAGPVRWERTAESMHWARITLSSHTRDEVAGRALANAIAGVVTAYRGASLEEQALDGRYAEVGYLVARVEQGDAPYHHRKELRLLLQHLDKLDAQLPLMLQHRVRAVLRQSGIGKRIVARIDEVEDDWTDPSAFDPARLLERLAGLDAERQRLLKRYDDGKPTELHELTEVLVAISTTLTQYADALHKLGVDPHVRLGGPQDRPVSDSVLHHDPVHARNLTDRTWAPGLHHKPSVQAEDAALIAARIQLSTAGRYGPFSLPQISAHATTGKLLTDIAADVVSAAERKPVNALKARIDFLRSLTADQARAVPARLLQQEQIPIDWPTFARMRTNAIRQQHAELTARAAARTTSASEAADKDTAARHSAIAAACSAAARQGERAQHAWQEFQARKTPETLATAQQAEALYEQRLAESLPSKDVLQTAIVSGDLPHLTALVDELNYALSQAGKEFRFTPELLHRSLRAETRRLLSPGGLILTVGNDPQADVSELVQFELVLDPRQLQEVLNHPVKFEEGQLGQIVQGGTGIGTTTATAYGANGALKLGTALSGLPDHNPVKVVATAVSPSIEYAKHTGLSVTGGATEYGLPGAVDVIQGEILRFRATRPRWTWRIRTSAVGAWSEQHVVTGRTAATLDLGISHAYTVGAPTDTVTIEQLGGVRSTELPEHVVSRADGLSDLADRAIAGLRQRLEGLDRIGHDQLRGMLTDDVPGRLAQAARPGGLIRPITTGGRVVAYAQLETTVVWEQSTMLGDSSKDHKIERLRVGFSGTSGGQTRSAGDSYAISAGGTLIHDLHGKPWDLGASGKAGIDTGSDVTASTGDMAIHPSVQRVQPTVGVKLRLAHRLTVHRVDKRDSFTLTAKGDAVLRMPENDAFRYGLPVPAAAILRGEDGQPRYGKDQRLLLRGDPEPQEQPYELPVWMQAIRGAGPALVQEFSGADKVLKDFLDHLVAKGLITYGELGGKDPALAMSQLANLERVCEQLARHRLETGYDIAAQEGILFQLDLHRTRRLPEQHTYRIKICPDIAKATFLGLTTGETVVNLDIGSNSTGKSGSWSHSLPWQFRGGLSNKAKAGTTPDGGVTGGRSVLGRSVSWATGSTVNRVSLTESTAKVAVFEVPHRLVVTDLSDESTPIAVEDGAARIVIDSEFCAGDTAPATAIAGQVDPLLLRSATFQAVDIGDPVGRLLELLPQLARVDSSALHHLSAFLNPRNLAARPELLLAPYRTGLLVTPVPSTPGQAVAQGRITTGRAKLTVTSALWNLRYVGFGSPVNGEINLTLGSTGITAGTSTGRSVAAGFSDGVAAADGSSYGGSFSGTRSVNGSASRTETQIGGIERLVIRSGQQYQFWADLAVVAELEEAGAKPQQVGVGSGALMLTMPEPDVLRLYGRDQLDLPEQKVAEVIDRLRAGTLKLDRRTAVSVIHRYVLEVRPQDVAPLIHQLTGLENPRSAELLPKAEQLAERRAEIKLPQHYDSTMGAAMIDSSSVLDPDGNESDLYREVLAALDEDALEDPVLAAGLRGDLAGLRWHGHIDNLLSPSGFVTEYPTAVGRRVQVRITLRYEGGFTMGRPPAEEPDANALTILQVYNYRELSRSVTSTTSYGGELDGTGAPHTAGIGTDISTSTSASSTDQNTRITRALWERTLRATRGYTMTVQINESVSRILTGELTFLVPRSVVDAEPEPGPADRRKVTLPRGAVAEGTTADGLFETVHERLGKPDMLTRAGVQLHRTTLENVLSAATRIAAFEQIASPDGYAAVQLPVPGHRSRTVALRVRAELSGMQLILEAKTQLGQIDREQHSTSVTTSSTHLLPATGSYRSTAPGGVVGFGLSGGEQATEKVTDGTGGRNETSMYERGPIVTVKVDVKYLLEYARLHLGRDGGVRTGPTDTAAVDGTAYLTMHRHEYDELCKRGSQLSQEAAQTG